MIARNLPHLRQRAIQFAFGGTASILFSSLATNVLRVASSMALTRLLDSRAFGVVGIITSVSVVIQLLSDIGVLPFVVRHERGGDKLFLDEIWTLRLIRSILLAITMALAAWPVAMFLQKPELAPVIAVWSVSLVIDGLSGMAFATAIRDGKLWRFAWSEILPGVAQLAIAIPLAIILRSYWALVIAMLASASIRSILSYVLFRGSRRRWTVSRERAAELWQFSRFIAPSSMMSLVILQTDKLVLARMMSLSAYGLYAIAAGLAAAPVAVASSYTRRVLYPAYAETFRSAPTMLRQVFYDKRRLVASLYLFATGALIGGAQLVIAILYDPRYLSVTPYLQILSVSAALILPNLAAEEVIIATGHVRVTLTANLARVAWLAVTLVAAAATGNTMLFVAGFGLIEVAALLCYWITLNRLRLLDLAQEGRLLVIAIGGIAAGWGLAHVTLMLLPRL